MRRKRSTGKVAHRVGALAAVMVLGTLVAGCSGMGAGGGDTESAADGGAALEGQASAEEERAARAAGGSANRAVVQTRAVIKTGQVAVTSEDLDETRQEVDELLQAFGGNVDREQTSHDDEGMIESSTVVMRVPVAQFGAAMDALENLGKMETSSSKSRDVTTEVIDVNERVETIQNSLDRLQKFQSQSDNIDDLIRFEDQITARESELSSLEAQQDYLADQTSFSTITLYLSTPETYVAPDPLKDAGFLAGLKGGWNALKDAVVVALTVVGAVLPFAIALALVGVPLWLFIRAARRRNRLAPAPPQPTTPDAG